MSSSYSTTILADSPIRYYRLGETSGTVATDSGSQAQNGTLHGGVTLNQPGAIYGDSNGSMHFDSTTGYISLPTTSLPTGASAWTIEAWVFLFIVPGDYKAIAGWGTNSSLSMATIFVMNNMSLEFSPSGGGHDFNTGAGTLTLNAWNHVVATYDGTTVLLYVNAVNLGTATMTENIALAFASIGAEGTGPDDYSPASIDEVAFYSTNLSAGQILTHYNAAFSTNAPYNANGAMPQTPLYDIARHEIVAQQAGTTATDTTTGAVYAPGVVQQGPGAAIGTSWNTKGDYTEKGSLTAGALNAYLLSSTDVSAYKYFSVHITGTFSATYQFQGSNNGSTFIPITCFRLDNMDSNNSNVQSTGSGQLWGGPLPFRYLAIQCTAYTSGTINGVVELYTQSPAPSTISIAAEQSGSWGVTANAGTNLNTSLLALESGGNLAILAGAIASAIMQANTAKINNVTPLMGNGTTGTGSQRVTIASDNTAFSVNAVESGTWTVQPGNTPNTSAWLTQPVAGTTGGSTPVHTISASGTNSTSTKGSAGTLYGFSISNSNAAARFFKLYNKSSGPTIGTDTPIMTVQLPANATVIRAFPVGLNFSSGIGWGLTTGIADADTGSVGTDISVDLDYK